MAEDTARVEVARLRTELDRLREHHRSCCADWEKRCLRHEGERDELRTKLEELQAKHSQLLYRAGVLLETIDERFSDPYAEARRVVEILVTPKDELHARLEAYIAALRP